MIPAQEAKPSGVDDRLERRTARATLHVVVLDPMISKVFPTDAAVNEALGNLIAIARSSRPSSILLVAAHRPSTHTDRRYLTRRVIQQPVLWCNSLRLPKP